MENFILQHLLISGVLYLLYIALFSRTSFFRINRLVLLAIPVVSVAIPLLAPFFDRPQALATVPVVQLPELMLTPVAAQAEAGSTFNWALYLYLGGAAVMFIAFALGLFRCYSLISEARYLYQNIYSSNRAPGPFAFIGKIVLPEKILESDKLEEIISHEKAHVEQGHSYDKLFYNLYTMLFWFNPFAHLLGRELLTVHECLADEEALQNSSAENYAHLLLSSAMGSEINLTGATPFFNSSLIKTRITMIYKAKTKNRFKALYLSLIPLLAIFTMLACEKTEENAASQDKLLQDQQEIERTLNSSAEDRRAIMSFADADQPPLFENCDAIASKQEQMKCFQQGIMQHVVDNFTYPELAREQGLEGKIYVEFTISEAGDINNPSVVKWQFNEGGRTFIGPHTDAETGNKSSRVKLEPAAEEAVNHSIELVKTLPKMAPALKDGKAVPVTFVLPIDLKLD